MTKSPLSSLIVTCATVAVLSARGALACDKLWNDICFTYAANDDVFWGSNCDFQGPDTGNARGGADQCGRLCQQFPLCERWSWTSYQGGTCYFKGTGAWTLVANQGVQCGFRKVPLPSSQRDL